MAKKKKKVKRLAPRKVKHELVVRVDPSPVVPSVTDLTEPLSSRGGKLTIPKTWISAPQLIRMTEKTPRQYVYQRPGKGGGKWDYVTVSYVQRVLDYVFGFNWDFEIVEHGQTGEGKNSHVWVQGKLTVRNPQGTQAIVKTQFGRSDVKQKSEGGNLDYGNDLKAAASDSLKKCASMLGIARDIYGKADYKMESGREPEDPNDSPAPTEAPEKPVELKKGQVLGPNGKPVFLCQVCDGIITESGANYSMQVYGKRLCKEDAGKARPLKKK